MKLPKEVPVGTNEPFYANFAAASIRKLRGAFLKTLHDIRLHDNKWTNEKYMEFSSLFLRMLYYNPNLFCPFDHPSTLCPELFHILFV